MCNFIGFTRPALDLTIHLNHRYDCLIGISILHSVCINWYWLKLDDMSASKDIGRNSYFRFDKFKMFTSHGAILIDC